VIIDKISNYLITRIENKVKEYTCQDCGKTGYRINEITEENGDRLFDLISDYVHIPFNIRFITNEVGEVIRCLFSIIDLPQKESS
jgi:hypothetical protein